MFRYLLDTNVVSELVRAPTGPVAGKLLEVGESTVCTSVIVACELRYGAAKKRSPALERRIDAVLRRLEVRPFAPPLDRVYAHVRMELAATGTPVGANDLLIAAHALDDDLTLVTRNVREFARVTGLRVVAW
ncbi:MAG: type II toxin-antitoxin system VapC family toxin [Trueperaceae bacterium]